jgi:sugar/nucleoside kinase (ribokinase family)
MGDSRQNRLEISVVGELNLDLVLYGLPSQFELDREHLASDLSLTLGSSSAIFAHNIALLGNRVRFHSAIGEDPLGELCRKRLEEAGVEVSAVRKFQGKQTGITVILPQPEKRYILTYLGSGPGTDRELGSSSPLLVFPATRFAAAHGGIVPVCERSRTFDFSRYQ